MGRIAQTQIYDHDGCHGNNLSPELSWSGEPLGTRSYAITLLDIDARDGRGWWHWIVYDIPPSINMMPVGAGLSGVLRLPGGGRQGRNDYGELGYDGPCPPPGSIHRYVVVVYALNIRRLPKVTDVPARIIAMFRGHILGEARRVMRYGR